MQFNSHDSNEINYSTFLIPKERKHLAWSHKNFVACLLIFGACTMFATGHLRAYVEQPIGAKLPSYTGTVSETAFQFFKDNKARQGKWGTCTATGDCGYYGMVNAADIPDIQKRWQPPETVQGGMVILIQSDNGKGQKFKYFSPSNTWQKSKDKQQGVVTVLGFPRDYHSYGLSRGALESLINLEDIYHSAGWRALLEPLLPEGLSMPVMSPVNSPLDPIREGTRRRRHRNPSGGDGIYSDQVPPVPPIEPLPQAESSNVNLASQEPLEPIQEATTRRRRRKSSIVDAGASESFPPLPPEVDAHANAAEATQLLQQLEVERLAEGPNQIDAHSTAAGATQLLQQLEVEPLSEEANQISIQNEPMEEKRERRRRRRVPGASDAPPPIPLETEPQEMPPDVAGGSLQVEQKRERRRRRRVPGAASDPHSQEMPSDVAGNSVQNEIVDEKKERRLATQADNASESTSTSCHIWIGPQQFDVPLSKETTFQYLLNHYIVPKGFWIGDATSIEIIEQSGEKQSYVWGTIKSMFVLQLSPQIKQLQLWTSWSTELNTF